ncbi:MAG TPA: ACP S-malonyltransferase [Blastocatellia bacterium]|nr:ACP S-malonyltransferase [Blastocatellia bacterium]
MSKIAFVFPGQGSQYAGMGRDLSEKYPAAAAVFADADQALGFSISRLCFNGPDEELKLTANTQPSILAVSTAACAALADQGIRPDFVAGHSLGEYSALVAAGAISLSNAIQVVRKRGTYMQEAVPVGTGAMAAILGTDLETIRTACEEAANGEVCSPANLNCPGQIVIGGNKGAVERAVDLLKSRGVRRAVMLPVSAPFHCALMRPAQERLTEDLNRIRFNLLTCPLVNNVDAQIVRDGEAARDGLVRQVSSPVRWEESIRQLIAEGVTRFVEVGPGRVLCGLIRQIDKQVTTINVEDEATLMAASGALK